MADKLKLAFNWAASCGGCEIAVLEIHEKVLKVLEHCDILFWPVAMDAKYKDVEAVPDGFYDICLFNGAIQLEEQEHLAHLLRKKSKILVAYGSCACDGCIPALANFTDRQGVFERAYLTAESTDNKEKTVPQRHFKVPEGELELPEFFNTVRTLDQTTDVDYYIPGCPPVGEQTWGVLEYIFAGNPLPPKGTFLGCGNKTVCEECDHEKREKKIKEFHRLAELGQIKPDPEHCLLEQGFICLGPATRSGCDARCLRVNMPCRGCYGPPEGVLDQGGKFLSALASVIDAKEPAEIEAIMNQVPDLAGYMYRFTMARSLLRRRHLQKQAAEKKAEAQAAS